MFHRIRTHLARRRVPRIAFALHPSAYPQRPLRLTRTHRLYDALDVERRTRRTAMRLALDGIVVVAGAGQAYSVGSLVLRTTGAAA
ncbi:hypothetical protein [Streptomyces sp. NBC_00859]|uniref:hypothetical protein n=1 Tax=Streptomyces sp. NBC_00859 TaxID=2903682 RepID=UPI003864A0D9|nr:hypothetical protein OG584_15655 [Streptomyces sp. NBC_00859]